MKYILTLFVIIVCCACDSKFDNEDSHAFRSKTIQEAVIARKNAIQTNSLQKAARPKISYWKDSEPEYEEPIVYDVMTEKLVEDLKTAINDIDVDDDSKANAILKFATIKCKKTDISEVFESISFLRNDVRDKLINDVIKTGTPTAKSVIVDTINWIKATEDVNDSWIEFVEEKQKQEVVWTADVENERKTTADNDDLDDSEFQTDDKIVIDDENTTN